MDIVVNVFSKPGCPQCVATAKLLGRLGIPFDKFDVTQDPDAMEAAMVHGFTGLPIVDVETADGEVLAAWSGYRDTHLRRLADGEDPRVLDERSSADSDTPAQETDGPVPGAPVVG